MSHTYKIIELVGSSPISSDDAVKNAIAQANKTVKHLRWFEVIETRGHLKLVFCPLASHHKSWFYFRELAL